MSREKRNYTAEFKEKAVELSYARGSVVEICRELDISPREMPGVT
ncbi:transposase [Arenibacter sp. ARW7G5Y1]|nr:transposase [Arenibacter sp. ARW7G5Y1]